MTRAESDFQYRVRELGCIVCLLFKRVVSPCDIHHMLRGGRRIGEMDVLGLCPAHHRTGHGGVIARHPTKARFESAYGTEEHLLWRTHRLAYGVTA